MIRDFQPADAESILALNAACEPEVGSMDARKLDDLVEWASVFFVVEVDGAVVGFLIGLIEGSDYQSPNYQWFSSRYPSFAYVDRVAIDEAQRGAGWGPKLYREFEAWAVAQSKPVLCAEVNVVPPNPRSLRFHDLFGFDQIEIFNPTGSMDYRVSMYAKTL